MEQEAETGVPVTEEAETDIPVTPKGDELYQRAIVLLYDKNFDKVKKLFENIKPQQIPNKLSNVINIVLDKMEADNPGLTIETVAEVGMRLLESLIADLTEIGLLQGMERQHFLGAIADIINDYALNHKDTISPQQVQEFLQTLSQSGEQGAPAEDVGPMLQRQAPMPAQTDDVQQPGIM